MKINIEKDTLYVNGQINFDNVVQSTAEGLKLFDKFSTIIIDLKGLERSDSSGLALISAWIRKAKLINKPIWFTNIPQFMQNLAKVSGIESLIPIR